MGSKRQPDVKAVKGVVLARRVGASWNSCLGFWRLYPNSAGRLGLKRAGEIPFVSSERQLLRCLEDEHPTPDVSEPVNVLHVKTQTSLEVILQ